MTRKAMQRATRASDATAVLALIFSGIVLGSAPAVSAADDARDDWQPGITIFTAGLPEDRSARADSEFQGAHDGESTGLPWSVGGGLEVASPALFDAPLAPRLVVHAEVAYVIDSNDPVTSVGDPDIPSVSPFFPAPVSIEGQGAALRAQAKPWVLTGGIGSQIEFELFDRAFYLRPSLEWMYRRDTIQGILGAGEGEMVDSFGNCAPCRLLYIDAEREKGYHSLGAGLDAGLDAGRSGPLLTRFFTTVRVYHILGDRKADFSGTGTWFVEGGGPSARVPNTSTLTGRYEREPVHYRIGAGFRVLWAPE